MQILKVREPGFEEQMEELPGKGARENSLSQKEHVIFKEMKDQCSQTRVSKRRVHEMRFEK